MAFDTIAYVGPAKSTVTLPNDGVLVQARKLGTRGGKIARYITIKIGAGLATKLAMHRDHHPMAVQLGRDNDAGKIALALDMQGQFIATKAKKGSYALTINESSAVGKFALAFDTFTRDNVEVLKMQNGPHFCAFRVTRQMLEADGCTYLET